MRVKAIKLGYYNLKRVRVDQVIDIPEKDFSDKWMEKLDGRAASRAVGESKKSKLAVVEAQEVSNDEEVI